MHVTGSPALRHFVDRPLGGANGANSVERKRRNFPAPRAAERRDPAHAVCRADTSRMAYQDLVEMPVTRGEGNCRGGDHGDARESWRWAPEPIADWINSDRHPAPVSDIVTDILQGLPLSDAPIV